MTSSLCWVLISLCLCVSSVANSQTPEWNPSSDLKGRARVVVTVSVDWEGMHLMDENLESMERFREQFPNLPLTHFLNAAHYLRGKTPESVTKKIRRVIRENDEVGLHIHCWRSLVERSGVEYQRGPTFWRADQPARKFPNGDEGHDVEMPAYSAEDVEKMARTSREILQNQGFKLSDSFRAAGWVADSKVLLGIRKAGFKVDSSATDRQWHVEELSRFAIYDRIAEVWPNVTKRTQPFVIETDAGDLLEMPDTGALADYVTSEEMDVHLKESWLESTDGKTRYVHVGFHQDNAAKYVQRIASCIAKWEVIDGVQFQTLENAALAVRSRALKRQVNNEKSK